MVALSAHALRLPERYRMAAGGPEEPWDAGRCRRSRPQNVAAGRRTEEIIVSIAPNEPTLSLDGRTITVRDPRGTRVQNRFAADSVAWSYHPGDSDPVPASDGTDACVVFEPADGLFVAHFHHRHRPSDAVALVLDLPARRALTIVSIIGDGAGDVRQVVVPGVIEGTDSAEVGDIPPARVVLDGVHSTPLRPGISLVAWCDAAASRAGVNVLDQRDPAALRSHGMLFGRDEVVSHRVFTGAGHMID